MDSLEKMSKDEETKLGLFRSILSLLSYDRIVVHDLQLRSRRTDDFIPELFYDTSRFSTFGQDWIVRAQVVGNENSSRRGLTFQLVQTTTCNLFLKYIFVRSPFGELDMYPAVFQHNFNEESQESNEQELPISQDIDINKLLAAKVIPLRLIMFCARPGSVLSARLISLGLDLDRTDVLPILRPRSLLVFVIGRLLLLVLFRWLLRF